MVGILTHTCATTPAGSFRWSVRNKTSNGSTTKFGIYPKHSVFPVLSIFRRTQHLKCWDILSCHQWYACSRLVDTTIKSTTVSRTERQNKWVAWVILGESNTSTLFVLVETGKKKKKTVASTNACKFLMNWYRIPRRETLRNICRCDVDLCFKVRKVHAGAVV